MQSPLKFKSIPSIESDGSGIATIEGYGHINSECIILTAQSAEIWYRKQDKLFVIKSDLYHILSALWQIYNKRGFGYDPNLLCYTKSANPTQKIPISHLTKLDSNTVRALVVTLEKHEAS